MPYPETEGQFKVEPMAEHSSENKIFVVTIPRAVNDDVSFPYLLFAFAVTQKAVRAFLVSSNDINHECALWEIVGNGRVNRGEVTEKKKKSFKEHSMYFEE